MRSTDRLVAHRGDRDGGIENTLPAFTRAAHAGAHFAECDIQFSRDFLPIVIHDNSLTRLCNTTDLLVSEHQPSTLNRACAGQPVLSTLQELLQWLTLHPQLTLFIEIKPDICERISPAAVATLLAPLLPTELLQRQIVLISESGPVIDCCKRVLNCRTGWVAEGRQPPAGPINYAFIPHQDAHTIPAWHARGVLVGAYTINDPALAVRMLAAGADLIETDYYSRMADSLEQA